MPECDKRMDGHVGQTDGYAAGSIYRTYKASFVVRCNTNYKQNEVE